MYVPPPFTMHDLDEVVSFIRTYPFATLITMIDGEPFATHLPLIVEHTEIERTDVERFLLRGHVARANPHWRAFAGGSASLAVFHGPHAYISPSWYVEQPAVPTWNYAAVHAYGPPRVIDDPQETSRLLDEMLARFEVGESTPLPIEQRRALEAEIVAFEMIVERWQGKMKLNQNRSSADRAAVVKRLSVSDRAGDRELAQRMQARVL